jgi:geranylgeranyl pyrophosphate synthase
MLPEYLSQVKKLVKDKMLKSISNSNKIEEAMAYSALADSKMIRAGLVFASSETNKNISKESIITLSSVGELRRTGSMVHDDLQWRDDDKGKRKQPANHIKYGEANAVLAGDALQALAYEIIVNDNFLSSDDKVNAINLLSKACGKNGMVLGQYLDIENENNQNIDIKKLDDIHNLKTGKLIECAVMLGQIGSSLEPESLNVLKDFSSKIGLAFQITDDILDVTQEESILGKNKDSDAKNNKLTYMDIIGLGEAKLKAKKLTDSALNSLNQSNITNIDKLIEMAKYLIGRES